MRVLLILLTLFGICRGHSVYRFYKSLNKEYSLAKSRRSFLPTSEPLTECPYICALHDRIWAKKCSGSVVAPRWVLTAAHCVDGDLTYVTYNSSRPYEYGASVDIIRTFRHGNYLVNQRDEGNGVGVVDLRHDIGLVKVACDMVTVASAVDPLLNTLSFPTTELANKEVTVYGFRRIKREKTEDLIASKLILKDCDKSMSWYYCICAVSKPTDKTSKICDLDSGGPVIYNGTMVGIVLMGPIECTTRPLPAPGSVSVFLSLYDYIDVIEATIHELKGVPALRSDNFRIANLRDSASRCKPALYIIMSVFVFFCFSLVR